MTELETERFLEYVTELGKRTVECGAQVRRAEDVMERVCAAYGFADCQVYATAAQLMVTVKTDAGRHFTQTRRITYTSNDLGALEDINAKSRRICEEKPAVEDMGAIIDEERKKPSRAVEALGFILPAGAFSVFFGGSVRDGLCAAALGIVVFAMDRLLRMKRMSKIVYTIFACFATGVLSQLLCKIGLGDNANFIMIGLIMLFIPTLAIVNGVREIFLRDIITGVCRLTEALMTAVAIALGFAAAIMIMGGAVV